MAMNAIPISYGEFYDVPRMIRFPFDGQWYFMRSHFDEEKDEYADSYDVYLLPFHSEDEFTSNPNYWKELTKAFHLGQIPIVQVGLDETGRRSIDGDKVGKWLSARKQEIGSD
jgi:hypothetical protein